MLSRAGKFLTLALSVSAFLVVTPLAQATPGQLDPTFGSGGEVKLLQTEEKIGIWGVATQPDGKVLLAGFDESDHLLLTRLQQNGELDTSFGVNGRAALPAAGEAGAEAVAVQPDGRIVVAGFIATGAESGNFLLARFTAEGKPDPTFGGGDGFDSIKLGDQYNEATSIAFGTDGRIAVAGEVQHKAAEDELGVAVVDASGAPDTEFGGEGWVTFESTAKSDEGVAVAVRPDNRVLVADDCGSGGGAGFAMAQFTPEGKLDPSFGGGDGIVIDKVPGPTTGAVDDLVLLPNGKAIAAGYAFDKAPPPTEYVSTFAAARYMPDGQIDPSFGESGYFKKETSGKGGARRVDITETGKILLSGGYESGEQRGVAVMRLTAQGTLDTGFGASGIVLRPVAAFGEYLEDAALDSQERLVTLSTAFIGSGQTTHDVARILGDREPPANQPPQARIKKVAKKIARNRLGGFSGTASDPDAGDSVARVELGLLKKPGRRAARSAAAKKPKIRWQVVKGTSKWKLKLKKKLGPGSYVVLARATDSHGALESTFSKKLGNRYPFRVTKPRRGSRRSRALGTASASPAVLYDQTSGAPGAGVPSMLADFTGGELASGECDGRIEGPNCFAIDDFTIRPGDIWLVKGVSVDGKGGQGDELSWVATESAGLPQPETQEFGPFEESMGAQEASGQALESGADDFEIPTQTPEGEALGAGHYWLTAYAAKSARSHQPLAPWSWDSTAAQSGMSAAWSSKVCAPDAAYKSLASCGQPGPDLRFKVEGEQIDEGFSKFKLGKRERTPDGGMNIFATFPGIPGEEIQTKQVGGKGRVEFLRTLGQVQKDGTVSAVVRVRPKGATARRLKEGRSYKVRISISYRRAVFASQALKIPAATQITTVRLKKKGR